MRFVIVISGWAPLGIGAVDCVFDQNKKAAGQVLRARETGIEFHLSGSFACSARHWTPVP
ncbi:hypothetical protein AJ88_07135 [Mesorhizobium amorphae CCBAU 01583]|nr:hypothetical protein AJ88_07135 [Mesorhizobium amorphae CCBAU 01583]